jgi:8-oxo-dGTP diphosphatase
MRHIGVGVILQDINGKFLLQLRDNKKNIRYPNKWCIFGGGIEEGELPIDAAVREMKEELDLKLERSDLSLEYVFSRFTYKDYLFLSKKRINPAKLKLHEGQAMKLFSRKQIIFMRRVILRERLWFIFHKK